MRLVKHALPDKVKHAEPWIFNNQPMASIADRLKTEIDGRDDVRAADVARAIGITKAAMSDILHGKTKQPKPENLLAIADFLGLELRWIISGKGPRTKEEKRRSTLDVSSLSDQDQARIQTIVDTFSQPQTPANSHKN